MLSSTPISKPASPRPTQASPAAAPFPKPLIGRSYPCSRPADRDDVGATDAPAFPRRAEGVPEAVDDPLFALGRPLVVDVQVQPGGAVVDRVGREARDRLAAKPAAVTNLLGEQHHEAVRGL